MRFRPWRPSEDKPFIRFYVAGSEDEFLSKKSNKIEVSSSSPLREMQIEAYLGNHGIDLQTVGLRELASELASAGLLVGLSNYEYDFIHKAAAEARQSLWPGQISKPSHIAQPSQSVNPAKSANPNRHSHSRQAHRQNSDASNIIHVCFGGGGRVGRSKEVKIGHQEQNLQASMEEVARQLVTYPGINKPIAKELASTGKALGLIKNMSEKELLKIKGVGIKTVKIIYAGFNGIY